MSDELNIVIDDDIPIPSRARVSKYNYPFAKMSKGQSFLIQVDELSIDREKDLTRLRHRLRNAVNSFKKTNNGEFKDTKFAVHQVLEEIGEGAHKETIHGVRVWRVE